MDSRNFEYMFYGFLAAWLLIVIYVVTLVVREHRLKRELDQVKAMLEDREKKEL
ncbi:MAG TPA: CcmD family protein [Bryobacteraceae bacterium]|nr:CcmD family protein [Bryobacteraceae bacterium]